MIKKPLLHGLLLLGTIGLIGCTNTNEETTDPDENMTQKTSEMETAPAEETTNETDTTNETVEMSSDWEAHYTTEVNQALLDTHENRYQEIRETFQNGTYTFEEPLVIQDPYGRAPLSALVLFETDEPMEITVTVEGQTDETDISHTYSGHGTEHEIPVLGLYPNIENNVTLTAETETGETTETTLRMATAPVPEDMLGFSVETAQTERMEEGLTFIQPSYYPTAVDSNGDVRWYSIPQTYNQLKRLDNGNLLLSTLEEGREDYDHITEMNMLGQVHQSITIDMENVLDSPPLHHDTIVLPNGNYLALLHDGSENYVEDEMAELDRETGEVVHRINFKDVFPDTMHENYTGRNEDVGDWLHINTVWKLEGEDALLLSLRNQDAILKLTYPEGEIEWLLAPQEDWPEELEESVLEANDDTLTYTAGPHAVEELPDQDGNEATLDILLFDNNRVYTRGNETLSEEYSRAVQYRINEEEGTVEEIWSAGEERGTDFYSRIVGDADYLPETENALMTSGHVLDEAENQRSSIILEVTREENPEVIFELRYGPFGSNEHFQTYRAERMSLYPNS